MTRLHVHVAVSNLTKAIGFYSGLFNARPCCAGSTYANWRVEEPPLNFAASTIAGRRGAMHFGLEVASSVDLHKIDRALRGPLQSAAALPWEVSVKKESTS
jgi:hypothetical protein